LCLAVGQERKEDVVANLDGVDVKKALARRDELEVDSMGNRPHLEE